jgi:probable HAF family extracellular repeat protein
MDHALVLLRFVRSRTPGTSMLTPCGISPGTAAVAAHETPTKLTLLGSTEVTVFDVPGGTGTTPFEINARGTIIGVDFNASSVLVPFIRTPGGEYSTFEPPDELRPGDTEPLSITDAGVIAGYYYSDRDSAAVGFIRKTDFSLLDYQVPVNGATDTLIMDINARGDTAGVYILADESLGFVRYRNGEFARVIPPGQNNVFICAVDCLNAAAVAAGTYIDANGGPHAFFGRAQAPITTVDIPGVGNEAGVGINARNELLGVYVDSHFTVWSFIRTANGKIIKFQAPDAGITGTQAFAINDAGAVAGTYVDARSVQHAFVRMPNGQFSEFDPNGSINTAASSINNSGEVVGYFYDAQGQPHGFIWKPRQ